MICVEIITAENPLFGIIKQKQFYEWMMEFGLWSFDVLFFLQKKAKCNAHFLTQKWPLWHKNRMKKKWKNSPCIQINRAELSIVFFFKWRNQRKGNGKSCSPLAWTNSFFMVLNLLVLSWQFLFELWIKSFFFWGFWLPSAI